jgi:hypothetical protein
MVWSKVVRYAGLPVLIACGMQATLAQPAAAQLIERSHEHIVDTNPKDEICGIPVTTTVDIIFNFQERLARSGFPLFMGTGSGTVTWTNPVNGQTVTNKVAGVSFKDLTATDNGDGTITLRTAITGIPEQVRLSDGTVAIKDVGRVVFVNVIDYSGTPTNTDDDVFISGSVESVSGPHPELESGFTLFCPTIVAALT